jgi:hypothetical protein
MVERFFDPVGGGFFDTAKSENNLGVLGTRRKPFQDSPTPAGNSVAAIALLRMHGFTNDDSYRDKAEQTIEVLGGLAEKYGIFASTYGIAAVHFSQPHVQVVVVGSDELADKLYAIAVKDFSFGKTVLRMEASHVTAQNFPAALAATIPAVPGVKERKTVAIVCSGFACQPPVSNPEELAGMLLRGQTGASGGVSLL